MLIPDPLAGCSLASSITAADVRMIKARYPGIPVVTYVNTTRRGEGRDRHLLHERQCRAGGGGRRRASGARTGCILIPDEFLARNVARQTAGEDHRLGRVAAKCMSASRRKTSMN